jgi:hypothetical protein
MRRSIVISIQWQNGTEVRVDEIGRGRTLKVGDTLATPNGVVIVKAVEEDEDGVRQVTAEPPDLTPLI